MHCNSSTPSSTINQVDNALTNYQPYYCSAASAISCLDEIVVLVSEIFYEYYEKEEVQRLLPLPFQKKYKELMSSECMQWHEWHRPLDPVPTEEEMLQMIDLRRKKCRRRKKQYSFPTT